MDILSAPSKPTKGLFQKIIGLHQPNPGKMAATVYLSPSNVHHPCLDPGGIQTKLDESSWDKHIVNIRDYPKLQVVQKDGGWFALNSAQLQLFQKWEREGKCSKVKVDIVSIHHVPPVLRNLMVLGANGDRKHFKRDLSDKVKFESDITSHHKALNIKSSQTAEKTLNSEQKQTNDSQITNEDSKYSHLSHDDSNNSVFHKPSNHVTLNSVQSSIISHSSPCHVGLKGSKSDPNGTVIQDYEDPDVGYDKSDMLYKTLSSFQLDKQTANTEGVQTARGYHKVHQIDPNDEDTSSEQPSEDGSDDDTDDEECEEYDYDVDHYGDDVIEEDEGSSEDESVYSNELGSELGWTDEGEEGEQTSDDVTYSSCSDTDSQTDKPDENECLL